MSLPIAFASLIFGNCLNSMAMESAINSWVPSFKSYMNYVFGDNIVLTPSIQAKITRPSSLCRDNLGNLYYYSGSGILERFCYQCDDGKCRPLIVCEYDKNGNEVEEWEVIPAIVFSEPVAQFNEFSLRIKQNGFEGMVFEEF